ncbi:MAG: hypothetical protein AVDCRST_MAG89-1969, partial [uncultured Gemmatimonadetes bacterium]
AAEKVHGRATTPRPHQDRPVHEGGLRVVVAANSFARAGPRPRLCDRCRALASCRPRQDPSARKGRRIGGPGALAPLDDRVPSVWV